jgi:hypothetical protein
VDCQGELDACRGLSLLCKNGNCNLACHEQSQKDVCLGAKVSCGGNQCRATCDMTYGNTAKFPSLTANGSRGCTNCGGVACL